MGRKKGVLRIREDPRLLHYVRLASRLSGCTTSEFVRMAYQAEADRVLEAHGVRIVIDEDADDSDG